MQKSTRIFLTYSTTALIVVAASSLLTYMAAWEWHPRPDTLEHEFRLLALAGIPLLGLSLVCQLAGDPLVWRVIRMLRFRERLAGASST